MSKSLKVERNPLVVRSAAIAVLAAGVSLLGVLFEWMTPEVSAAVLATGVAVAGLVVAVVRPSVTPLVDPRDVNGNSLIEVDQDDYDDYEDFADTELLIEVEDEEQTILGL